MKNKKIKFKVDQDFKLDLQLFAAEDQGKTEKPTSRKIAKAKKKGIDVKTVELTSFLVLCFGVLTLLGLSSFIFQGVREMVQSSLSSFSVDQFDQQIFSLALGGLKILAPLLAMVLIGALLGNIFQVGFKFSLKPLKFKGERIKFNFRKKFLSGTVFWQLAKSFLKISVIFLITALVIIFHFEEIMASSNLDLPLALEKVLFLGLKIILGIAVFVLFLAIADYWWQRREFWNNLKMTPQEVKEELKETEGDPLSKVRLSERRKNFSTFRKE